MSRLPGILADIAAVTDEATALKMAREFGGRRIKLPRRPGPNSAISKLVGAAAAAVIVGEIGYGDIYIPCGTERGGAGRRELAARLLDQGLSHPEVAKRVDVSQRTVERVSSKRNRTLPLFEDS